MIVYKMTLKAPNQTQVERLFSVEAVREGKLRDALRTLFGWCTHAPDPTDEEGALRDRRFLLVFENALMDMANQKIPNVRIMHDDRWVSLEQVEVA